MKSKNIVAGKFYMSREGTGPLHKFLAIENISTFPEEPRWFMYSYMDHKTRVFFGAELPIQEYKEPMCWEGNVIWRNLDNIVWPDQILGLQSFSTLSKELIGKMTHLNIKEII